MNKADMVEVVQGKGGWVRVWTQKDAKKAEVHEAMPSNWAQSVEVFFKDFNDLEKVKVGDVMEFRIKGSVTNIDEKGLRVKVEMIKL